MKVWIVNVNEPLPTDEGHPRLWRMGQVFGLLRQRGHEVTWWSSTMHHFDKRLRHAETTEVAVDDLSRIIQLHGRHYARNISLERFLNHRQLGREFRRLAPSETAPDVIIASIPILDLPREASRYARPRGIPLVIDVRDKWPDFMVDQAPGFARGLAEALLRPLRQDAREACRTAQAIWGVAPSFVEWGLAQAGRSAGVRDRDFPHAYPRTRLEAGLLSRAEDFWDEHGIKDTGDLPTLCFIGSLNATAFDFSTLLGAMEQLQGQARLVVCGKGPEEHRLRQLSEGLNNVIMAGWVGEPELRVLMQRSTLGLTPYRNRSNFSDNLPNKFLEYMSQGLPIVSCLGGYSRQVLERGEIAVFYPEKDPQGLVQVVKELLGDEPRRKLMADAARKLYEQEFRAEVVYGRMIDALEEIAR